MKKKYTYMLFPAMVMVGCSQETLVEEPVVDSNLPVFAATVETATSRAALTDEFKINWQTDDQISIFPKVTDNKQYQLSEGANTTTGRFKAMPSVRTVSQQIPLNGAVYPYSEINQVSSAESNGLTFTLDVPDNQAYTSTSFDPSAFPMVAVSTDHELSFKNVCGLIMLQLTGSTTLTEIRLQGNNDEDLAGTGTSTLQLNGLPTWESTSGKKQVVLNLQEAGGVKLSEEPTPFYLVVSPVQFSKGFTVTYTDTEGQVRTLTTSKKQDINRNQILRMPVAEGTVVGAMKQLIITHTLKDFQVPTLLGVVKDGKICWGDSDTEQEYSKEAVHTYESEGPYQVTISTKETTGVSFETISGIQKIDFSKF